MGILFFVNVKMNLNQIKHTYTAHAYSLDSLIGLWIRTGAFQFHHVIFLSFRLLTAFHKLSSPHLHLILAKNHQRATNHQSD